MMSPPRSPAWNHRVRLLVLFLFGLPTLAAAQASPGAAPSSGPGWLPRVSFLDVNVGAGVRVTAAERAAVIARLDAIEGLIKKPDAMARPRGFEGVINMHWAGSLDTRDSLIGYEFHMGVHIPTFKINPEGPTVMRVTVNPYPEDLTEGFHRLASDDKGDIWPERPIGEAIPGVPPGAVIYDHLEAGQRTGVQVLLTSRREPVWIDVSKERFLNTVIALFDNAAKDSSYEEWLKGAAERKQVREQTLAALSTVGPKEKAQAAELRKTLQQAERDGGEQLKAIESSPTSARTQAAKLRARLAAMTPGERASPAWLADGTGGGSYELVAPRTPRAVHLVSLNPEFYRTKGSPVAVRAIRMTFYQRDTQLDAPWKAVYESYKAMDWTALARMLDP
jgi:hypothetical protein